MYGELYHHGIKGMHWGIRRFQNKDGTLTNAGKTRYKQYKNIAEKSYEKALSTGNAKIVSEIIADNSVRAEREGVFEKVNKGITNRRRLSEALAIGGIPMAFVNVPAGAALVVTGLLGTIGNTPVKNAAEDYRTANEFAIAERVLSEVSYRNN